MSCLGLTTVTPAKLPKRLLSGSSVVVYPGTDEELHGTVVEDFADLAGTAVEVAGERIVEPARRWAVNLDDGGLVFVDDDSIALASASCLSSD